MPQTIKVAHFRLAYSRQMFVVAYPHETQDLVLDAHNRAFAFFGRVPQRLIYDNLKAVVEAILVGKGRVFNRRLLAMANHHLFAPVACTPAPGWEKGQVENQVGNVREWLFTPMAQFAVADPVEQENRPDHASQLLSTTELVPPALGTQRPKQHGRANLARLNRQRHLHQILPMGLDLASVDGIGEEAVDVLVLGRAIGPIHYQVAPVADARHQVDAL